MSEPTGKIVARPMVARACGHEREFQRYEVDRFRAQRLEKFQKSRCAECVEKLNEEKRMATIPKGDALKLIPFGTQVTLTIGPDGWSGTLFAKGTTVKANGVTGAGPQSVIVALARLWIRASEDQMAVDVGSP